MFHYRSFILRLSHNNRDFLKRVRVGHLLMLTVSLHLPAAALRASASDTSRNMSGHSEQADPYRASGLYVGERARGATAGRHEGLDSDRPEQGHEKMHPETIGKKVKHSPYHYISAADLIDNSEGLGERQPWEIIMRQAEVAARSQDYDMAEGLYAQAFLLNPPEAAHKRGYLQLASMYEQSGQIAKMAAIYEKYIARFKNDSRLAQIYMRLGHLYREMGACSTAIARFYNVLNVAISVDSDSMDAYRALSLQAQRDIADTHFIMGNYTEADKFYRRLLLLDLPAEDRMNILYKINYIGYANGDYSSVAAGLETFLDSYPDSQLVPESYYMLANVNNRLGEPREAVKQVLKLLRTRGATTPQEDEIWQYWRKKTANQLAQSFYDESDFLSAIKIYQAMVPLKREPSWQWPVIYKIGLCFERLYMYPKAQQAYQLIKTGEEWQDLDFEMTPTLQSIKDMATWRFEHLQWNDSAKKSMQNVLEIAGRYSESQLKSEKASSPSTKPN